MVSANQRLPEAGANSLPGLGSSYVSFLGCSAVDHVPTHALRFDPSRSYLLLCRSEHDRLLHDLPLAPRDQTTDSVRSSELDG